MTKRTIELVPYSPIWQNIYLRETQCLQKVLRNNLSELHHIGSTAIPSILAKPTLDVLCAVHTLDGIEAFKDEFAKLGLEFMEENGITGRLFFVRKAKDGIKHLVHIHIFKAGDERIDDHIDFRDYLNSEDEVAKAYEKIKVELKEKHEDNPALYTAAKNEFIETVLKNIR